MRRSVQAKNRSRRHERRLLLGVISVRSVKEFAFKIAFKTVDTSCGMTVKRYSAACWIVCSEMYKPLNLHVADDAELERNSKPQSLPTLEKTAVYSRGTSHQQDDDDDDYDDDDDDDSSSDDVADEGDNFVDEDDVTSLLCRN